MAQRLWALLDKAGANVIGAPSIRPDSCLGDEFSAVMAAARAFSLGRDRLDQRLWTRSGPFWNGDIARTLGRTSAAAPPLGFVLLLAQSVGRRAALLGHAQPFVVNEPILGDLDRPGPYLVLIACTLDPIGKAQPLRAFAQAILSAACFMPVASQLERDVLAILLALREKLDCQGLECTIRRPFSPARGNFDPGFQLIIEGEDRSRRTLSITASQQERAARKGKTKCEDSFEATPRRLSDGSFVSWLERMLLGDGGSKVPQAALAEP